MKDGVGERLISINPSALNVPAFKNAGWGSPSEIRRTYSPPIPVGAGTEYFTNNHPRSIRDSPIPPPVTGIALGNPDAEDGLVTGGLASHFSNESVEMKAPKTESTKGSRRAREIHREEDDSSDLSDDSDDDDGSQAFVSPHPRPSLFGRVLTNPVPPNGSNLTLARKRLPHARAPDPPPSALGPRSSSPLPPNLVHGGYAVALTATLTSTSRFTSGSLTSSSTSSRMPTKNSSPVVSSPKPKSSTPA